MFLYDINSFMRPIKATFNSSINSTAYVVECRYHNTENKSLVIVGKLAEDPIPTNYSDLIQASITKKLSASTILDKQYHREIVLAGVGTEEYACRL